MQRPPFEIDYQYVFELKYLKDSESLATLQQQATTQLLAYVEGEKKLNGMPNLQAWVVIVKDEVHGKRVV